MEGTDPLVNAWLGARAGSTCANTVFPGIRGCSAGVLQTRSGLSGGRGLQNSRDSRWCVIWKQLYEVWRMPVVKDITPRLGPLIGLLPAGSSRPRMNTSSSATMPSAN